MENREFLTQAELDRITAYILKIIELNKELLTTAERARSIGGNSGGTGSGASPKQQRPDAQLAAAERELNKIYAERARYMTQIDAIARNAGAVQAAANVKAQRAQELALIRAIAKEEAAAEGSDARKAATLSRMIIQYRQINKETAAGAALAAQMEKEMLELSNALLKSETARGSFGRNVGNYASGFNALGFQVQQVARELPSLAHSLPQFFLAISNNLPMLADELGRARSEFSRLKAEGKEAVPVGKQLANSIFSWQTALVVGITLLVKFGSQAIKWASNAIKAARSTDEFTKSQKALSEAHAEAIKSTGNDITKLELLYNASQDVSRSLKERKAAVDEMQRLYPKYLGNMSDESILAGNAASAYNDLRESLIQKAVAQAAADKIAEIEVKRAEELAKLQNNPKGAGWWAAGVYAVADATGIAAAKTAALTYATEQASVRQSNAITQVNDKYDEERKVLENLIDVRDLLDGPKPEKTSRARLKALEDERRAREDLATSEIDDNIGVIRRTLALNKASINERMSMVDDLYDLEEERARKLYETQRENLIQKNIDENTTYKEDGSVASTIDRVQAEKNVQYQLIALEYAFNAKIVDITDERIKQISDLENKRVQDAIRSVQAHLNILNRTLTEGESTEMTDLSAEYAKGLMSRERYEQRQLEISRYYADAREQSELNAMQSRLDAREQSEPNAMQSRLDAMKADPNIDIDEQQAIIDLEQEIADKEVDIQARKNDEIIEDNQRMHDKIAEAAKTAFNGLLDITTELVNMQTERKLAALDKQLEASQKATEDEIDRIDRLYEHGAISEEQANARKAKAEQEQKLREEQISQQRAEIQKRQARMQVVVQTAQAIMQGAGSAPWPWNLIPIGFAVATGAIQLAAVNAAQYAHGTPEGGHPGGLAWVGDGGRAELVTYGGKGYKTPAVPTLIDLPKGAEVLPDYNIAVRDMILASISTPIDRYPSDTPYSDSKVLARIDQTNTRLDKLGRINEIHLAEYRREKANRRFDEFRRRPITRKIN